MNFKQTEINRNIDILRSQGENQIANRIEELQKLHLEDPEESEINHASLDNFVKFILGYKSDVLRNLERPLISISSEGNLNAEYDINNMLVLGMEFIQTNVIKVVTVKVDKKDMATEYINGTFSASELTNKIEHLVALITA